MKISKQDLDALYDLSKNRGKTDIQKPRRHKYGSEKEKTDNITFDSGREGSRYRDLKFQEEHGYISNLRLQVPFVLIEKFKYNRKTIRGVKYYADFVYIKDGNEIVEDSKGYKTPVYIIKRKMLLKRYPEINFIET